MSQRKRLRKKRKQGSGARLSPPSVRDASGRVHLLLHGERMAADAHVTLSGPLFEQDWQNDVTVSAANTCFRRLREGLDEAQAIELTAEAMQATSKLADGFLARAANGVVACKPGCDHCCHQSVGVTTAEALTIADHVRRNRSEEQLDVLLQRLSKARERTRGLSADERYSPDLPCPFLEHSRCTIYEVRPLSCRGMNSLDAEICAKNLRDPEARATFLQTGAGAPSFLEPIRAFHAVSAGLQLALSELFGLDMLPLDLTAAMTELLHSDGSIATAWLAGASPLQHARGGNTTHSTHIRKLSGTLLEPDTNTDPTDT